MVTEKFLEHPKVVDQALHKEGASNGIAGPYTSSPFPGLCCAGLDVVPSPPFPDLRCSGLDVVPSPPFPDLRCSGLDIVPSLPFPALCCSGLDVYSAKQRQQLETNLSPISSDGRKY